MGKTSDTESTASPPPSSTANAASKNSGFLITPAEVWHGQEVLNVALTLVKMSP